METDPHRNDAEWRFAILVAVRCPRRFVGCTKHLVPVHRTYWNGYRGDE